MSLVLVFLASPAMFAADTPGVATGEKIGNIVKAAVSTALPGLSGILDLIWSKSGKQPGDAAKKTDLDKTAADKAVKDEIMKAIQGKLQPVSKVADELGVVQRFLDPCVTATQELVTIRVKMKDQTPDWQAIANGWQLAKIQINNLKGVSDADLNKIRDLYLRARLTQIRKSNDSTVVSIDQAVTQKNLDNLRADLPVLLTTLADMSAVAGYEFAELQADLTDLAQWAKGAAGGATAPKHDVHKRFLDSNLPALQ
jgi:hypothetical protein